jgi:hypothetical protein
MACTIFKMQAEYSVLKESGTDGLIIIISKANVE